MSVGDVVGGIPFSVWVVLVALGFVYLLLKLLRKDASNLEKGEEKAEKRARVNELNSFIDSEREVKLSAKEAADLSGDEVDFEGVKTSAVALSEKVALYEKDHALVSPAVVTGLLRDHKALVSKFVSDLSTTVTDLNSSFKVLKAAATQLRKENTQLTSEAAKLIEHMTKVKDVKLEANIKARQGINKQIFDYNTTILGITAKLVLRRQAELGSVIEFLKRMKDLQNDVSKVKSVDELRVFFTKASGFLVSQQTFFAQAKIMQLEFTKLVAMQQGAFARKKVLFDTKDALQQEYRRLLADLKEKTKVDDQVVLKAA